MIADEQLQELQHFAELGRLSASLLHEISNLLTAALLHLEVGGRRPAIRQARHNIYLLRRYVEAARQLVRRQSRSRSFWVRLQIEQLKPLLLPLARQAGVRLIIITPPRYRLYGDPVKFQQVISNLVTNAIDAYRPGAYHNQFQLVKVDWQIDQAYLTIRVTDRGAGISADALPHIFENFRSSKTASGRGLGLGLAFVKQTVESLGGSIYASSSSKTGTCFRIKLPQCQKSNFATIR